MMSFAVYKRGSPLHNNARYLEQEQNENERRHSQENGGAIVQRKRHENEITNLFLAFLSSLPKIAKSNVVQFPEATLYKDRIELLGVLNITHLSNHIQPPPNKNGTS